MTCSPAPETPMNSPTAAPRFAMAARAPLLALLAALLLALQGCACISAGEYGPQCCSACGTLCSQVCIPVCVDTALGRGPFNSTASVVAESEPRAAPVVLEAATEAAAVAY